MNSSSKQLLVVTYHFPFDGGESFVAEELVELAKYFDKIYVLPSRACLNRSWLNQIKKSVPRKMPDRCQVILPTVSRWSAFWRSLGWLLRLSMNARGSYIPRLTRPQAIKDLINESIKASLFLGKRPKEAFHHLEIHSDLHLAYCYWKTDAATALSLLSKLNPDGVKFVCRCHGGDLYYDLPHRPTRPFDPLVCEQARLVMPVSKIGAEHLIEHGFSADKVEVQRLGIELPKTVSTPSTDGVWRLVSCSYVNANKRVDLLARALSMVTHPFEWIHFGDGAEMQNVQAVIGTIPANGKVILKGSRPRQEIFDHYKTQPLDLFVNLSMSEGVPVSVMEALAHGIPVIATDAGGTRELVDSQVGNLIPIAVTAEDVKQSIVNELSSSQTEKRLAARQRAENLCDSEKNYARFAERLLSL